MNGRVNVNKGATKNKGSFLFNVNYNLEKIKLMY
jgi:hypothetical protein